MKKNPYNNLTNEQLLETFEITIAQNAQRPGTDKRGSKKEKEIKEEILRRMTT